MSILGPHSQHFILFITYELVPYAWVLHYTWCKGLPEANTLAYWDHLYVRKKMKCCGSIIAEAAQINQMPNEVFRKFVWRFLTKTTKLPLNIIGAGMYYHKSSNYFLGFLFVVKAATYLKQTKITVWRFVNTY